MQHHRRILAHRIEHDRALRFGRDLAENFDAFRFELLEVRKTASTEFNGSVHEASAFSNGIGSAAAIWRRHTQPMRTVTGAPAGSSSASAPIPATALPTCDCRGSEIEAIAMAGVAGSRPLRSAVWTNCPSVRRGM